MFEDIVHPSAVNFSWKKRTIFFFCNPPLEFIDIDKRDILIK